MTFLLDTNVLIRLASAPARLKPEVVTLITGGEYAMVVSYVSLWEIQIKRSVGKLPEIHETFFDKVANEPFQFLNLKLPHILRLGALPLHHKDPFDRMLVAQSLHENLTFITTDDGLGQYGIPILKAS